MNTEGEHTHTWRYSNAHDVFYCTTYGCDGMQDPDTGEDIHNR